ncbi:hypothetical protein ACLB0R_00885 [Sphingomonas sp. GlSt437]|uniref:hypothetical protein n=1 Tax=Sphingomonas sp. GlSt437 TaxID=3389970 RepID=UPI003A867C7E
MSARDAIGWGALGAGLTAALVFAAHGVGKSADAEDKPAEAAAPADKSSDPGKLAVDGALAKRIGLRTAPLGGTTMATITHGFARGIDTSPLASIEADIATARAAAQASAAEAKRLGVLAAADQSASRQALEAARAQAVADAAKARFAEQRVALEFGPGLGAMGDGARRALLAEIARGAAVLVRVDIAAEGVGGVRLASGGAIRLLGRAAQADPKLQSAGMLGLVRGAEARQLNTGRTVDVIAQTGTTQAAVFVPTEAVVRWHGGQWVYRATSDGKFERVSIDDGQPASGGWLVSSGLAPGDRVVVAGAGALLALDRAGELSQGGG